MGRSDTAKRKMYISANAGSNSAKCSVRGGITNYKSEELLSTLLCSDLKFMRNFNKIRLLFHSFEGDIQKCIQTENMTTSYASFEGDIQKCIQTENMTASYASFEGDIQKCTET